MGVRSSKLFWSHDAGSCWGLEEYELCNKLTFRLRDLGDESFDMSRHRDHWNIIIIGLIIGLKQTKTRTQKRENVDIIIKKFIVLKKTLINSIKPTQGFWISSKSHVESMVIAWNH